MTARKASPGRVVRPPRKPPDPDGPPGCGYTKWVWVTPEIATEWLEHNEINRTLRDMTARKLADIMTLEKWGLNPQVIIIDWNKDLVDGQHRLWAVVFSGKAQWFQVTFDIDPICRQYVDTGRSKTVGDLLSMVGVPDPNNVAAVAKLHWAYENLSNTLWHPKDLPDKEIFREVAIEHQELMTKGVQLGRQIDKYINLPPRAVQTAVYLILRDSAHVEEMLPEFIRGIKEGTGLGPGDPRLACTRIGGLKNSRKIEWSTGDAPVEQQGVALILKAWNHWVTGKKVTYLRWHAKDLPMPRAR